MRVISGIAKGRTLKATSSPEMRPTTDTARRTIFDILGDAPVEARVLDLFAGAGTLGIEALSRGAHAATFVERDRAACSVIETNLRATELHGRARVVRTDVLRYLVPSRETAFDLVFLDPPYDAGLRFVGLVLGKLAGGSWVAPGGTVVAEAPVGHVEWPPGFREIRARRFGRSQVTMAVRDEGPGHSHLSGDI